jgi:multicomponent Na+:H+ antiporter subunit D
MFGALAFCLLILSGYYPPELRAINLDTDWFYRKGSLLFYNVMDRGLNGINAIANRMFAEVVPERLQQISRRPLTLLMSLYRLEVEDLKRGTSPEDANLIPMGVPVLISIVFLFALFVVFVLLA